MQDLLEQVAPMVGVIPYLVRLAQKTQRYGGPQEIESAVIPLT